MNIKHGTLLAALLFSGLTAKAQSHQLAVAGTRFTLDEKIIPGYAALVRTTAGGISQFILCHGTGLAGFAADDGRLLWRYTDPHTRIARTYTPVSRGDLILSPNGYGGGLALFKLVRGERGLRGMH